MQLIKRKSHEELSCEEEGFEYEEYNYFSNLFINSIVDEHGQIIGDMYGRLIDGEKLIESINNDEQSNFFIEMDEISQLCCHMAEFILEHEEIFEDTKKILFLNRLSLKENYISTKNEEKALELVLKDMDVVVYSFGQTELDDDFPEQSDDYWDKYEEMLNCSGWHYIEEYEFYIKGKASLGEMFQELFTKPLKENKKKNNDISLASSLQYEANLANTMMIELELEGEIINQSFYEYDQCHIEQKEDGLIVFMFYLSGRKSGAFMTDVEDIKVHEFFRKNETPLPLDHFYLRVKGKQMKPFLTHDMLKVFNQEVELPANFNSSYLYNLNRDSGNHQDKSFISECFNHDLFEIKKFAIEPIALSEEERANQHWEVLSLKEYSKESDSIISSLYQFISMIQKNGYEVKRREGLEGKDGMPHAYPRAYIPEWDMMISPDTQNISTLLSTFAQQDRKVCIISNEWNGTVVAYLVKRTKKYHEVFKIFEDKKIEQILKAQQAVWDKMFSN